MSFSQTLILFNRDSFQPASNALLIQPYLIFCSTGISVCAVLTSHRPVTLSLLVSLLHLSSLLPLRKPEQPFENVNQARPSLPSILQRLRLTQQHSESSPWPPRPTGISALDTCLLSFLTISVHCMWPHWPLCPSLKISRSRPLLLHFLACYFPKY